MTDKLEKKLEKINARIAEIRKSITLMSDYKISDTSTQAELRLSATWSIRCPVDEINGPKHLYPGYAVGAHAGFTALGHQINDIAALDLPSTAERLHGRQHLSERINARSKSGSAQRAEAKINFEIEAGTTFLGAHKAALKKLSKIREKIAALQAKQKALLPAMRRANSEYLATKRAANAAQAATDTAALESGAFWGASKEALKGYFHPPFDRNYLADVSERWRAALYVEMESTAWKSRSNDWRHKNVGTGRGYLCGIDDNGDEWGHLVDLHHYLERDAYNDMGYAASVEDAMSALFEIPLKLVQACTRQGDLLFCPAEIPQSATWRVCPDCNYGNRLERENCARCGTALEGVEEFRHRDPVELHPQSAPWEVRESHTISSPTLRRNGQWFQASDEIAVTHTSHAPVTLPAGSYRLYALQVADAD